MIRLLYCGPELQPVKTQIYSSLDLSMSIPPEFVITLDSAFERGPEVYGCHSALKTGLSGCFSRNWKNLNSQKRKLATYSNQTSRSSGPFILFPFLRILSEK